MYFNFFPLADITISAGKSSWIFKKISGMIDIDFRKIIPGMERYPLKCKVHVNCSHKLSLMLSGIWNLLTLNFFFQINYS